MSCDEKTEQKLYTERDLVLAKREGFDAGTRWQTAYERRKRTDSTVPGLISAWSLDDATNEAKSRYPLPKVTRVRIENDSTVAGVQWRVRQGCLQVRRIAGDCGTEWEYSNGGREIASEALWPTSQRIAMWADLLANPTETVDVDD